MFTVLKWLAGFITSLVLILSLVVLFAPHLVDANDYRDNIADAVKKQTGRDLNIDGELSISVFPWLGFEAERLALSQPQAIGGNMLEVERAEFRVRLLPLLKKNVEIDTIVLDQPKLSLITLANGQSSFDGFIGNAVPPTPETANTQTAESQHSDAATAFAIVIQGLRINEGTLDWDDRGAGQHYLLEELNIESGNLIATRPTPFEITASVTDLTTAASETASNWSLTAKGEAQANIESSKLVMQNSEISVLQDQQSVDLEFESLTFSNGLILIRSLNANASLPASLGDGDALNIQSEMEALSYDIESQELSVSSLSALSSLKKREFQLQIPALKSNLGTQTVNTATATLSSEDLIATLNNLKLNQIFDSPKYRAHLEVQQLNAKQLLKDLHIEHTALDPNALKQLTISSTIQGSDNSVKLDQLTVLLDESTLNGNISVEDFTAPSISFALALDQLNLDRYLPKDEQQASNSLNEADVQNSQALIVPMAALRGVNASGHFTAQTLISGGLELNDINVDVKSTKNTLSITPRANLYEGSLNGQIEFNESNGAPSLQINNTLDLVSLAQLLTAADVTDQLSGIGSVDVELNISEQDSVQSQTGVIKINASKGAVQGLDVSKMVNDLLGAYQQYKSLKLGDAAVAEQESSDLKGASLAQDITKFADLSGTFLLNNNLLTNNDFNLSAPWLTVTGDGTIDIASQTLDYRLHVNIVQAITSSDADQAANFEPLIGIPISIKLSGALTQPHYSIDLSTMVNTLIAREKEQTKADYLKRKLNIDDGGKLSSKEIIKQALLNKALKKDQQAESEPVPYESYQEQAETQQPVGDTETVESNQPNINQESSDADQANQAESESPEDTKQALKEQLAEKLLESLFD